MSPCVRMRMRIRTPMRRTRKRNKCIHVTAKMCVTGVRTALSFACTDIHSFDSDSYRLPKIKMAPVSNSKLLLLGEEEEEDKLMNWYWLLQLLQQPRREKDGTGGGCTPSFRKEWNTEHIPPSSSWVGTRWWQFSSSFSSLVSASPSSSTVMGFAIRVRSAGQKYGPTCHQRDRADVTEFVTLVRLSSLGQHVGVLALAGYKRRKSALTAGPIRRVSV